MKKLLLTKYIIIAPVLFLLSLQVGAQPLLTLDSAVNIALKNSLNLQIVRNDVRIAHINDNYGVAGGLPVVNATGSDNELSTSIDQRYSDATRNTLRNNVESNNLSASLNGSFLVYNGSRVVSAKKRLNEIYSQSQQQLASRITAVASGVMLRYYDIVRQQSYGHTLEKTIAVSQKKLDIVKAQQSVGMANNSDLFQAQVDLNTQVIALQSQQLVIRQDLADILAQLTLNPDSLVTIDDTIVVDKSIVLDTILHNIDYNPDVIAADQQIAIYRYLERETNAQRYPSLNLNAGYNVSRVQNAAGFTLLNQQLGPYAGVGLNVPIFNGGIYKRQEAVARINTNIARLQRDTLKLNFIASAIKYWQAYTISLKQLETAQQTYELADKLLNIVLQRFQVRQNTILDIENAQQSYENAANQLVNVEYAAKVAEIQLKRIANRLDL